MYLFLLIDDNKMGIFLKASDVSFKIYALLSPHTMNSSICDQDEYNSLLFHIWFDQNYGNYTIDYHDKSLHHSQK